MKIPRTYKEEQAYNYVFSARTHEFLRRKNRRNKWRPDKIESFLQKGYNRQIEDHLFALRDASLGAMYDARKAQQEPALLLHDDYSLLGVLANVREAVGDKNGKLMQSDLVERCRFLWETLSTIVESAPYRDACFGGSVCSYCDADSVSGDEHDVDCPYRIAQELIGTV